MYSQQQGILKRISLYWQLFISNFGIAVCLISAGLAGDIALKTFWTTTDNKAKFDTGSPQHMLRSRQRERLHNNLDLLTRHFSKMGVFLRSDGTT